MFFFFFNNKDLGCLTDETNFTLREEILGQKTKEPHCLQFTVNVVLYKKRLRKSHLPLATEAPDEGITQGWAGKGLLVFRDIFSQRY